MLEFMCAGGLQRIYHSSDLRKGGEVFSPLQECDTDTDICARDISVRNIWIENEVGLEEEVIGIDLLVLLVVGSQLGLCRLRTGNS